MKTKILMVGLLSIFLGCLNACTVNSSETTPAYTQPRYTGYPVNYGPEPGNYIAGYSPYADDTDFNHDSAVGYGGVNVYNYDGI